METPKANILLIDDDEDQALYYKDSLLVSNYAYNIDIIIDPERIRDAALKHYQLVITDYNMPGMNGLEVLEYVHSNHKIPVIILTGQDQQHILAEALEKGAQDYLIKSEYLIELIPFIVHKNLIDYDNQVRYQKQVAEQIRVESKNEVLEQIFITLAHHINNSTTAISGFAQLCNMDTNNKANNKKLIEISIKETKRITAVLNVLEKYIGMVNTKTVDYVDIPNAMFDIAEEVKKQLDKIN